jgi:hypothetical protein
VSLETIVDVLVGGELGVFLVDPMGSIYSEEYLVVLYLSDVL